ncbi:MAG: Outer rane lipoproteinsorting protein [Gemmatimonadetes bacterium]|nr:Outer rane lipoproteinsorting protein [Gemmatimonadota bacterium]
MRKPAVLAVFLALCAAAPARAQATAAQVAAQARDRWEQRLRDVRSFTLVEQAMGTELTVYAERTPAGGWRARAWSRGADGRLRAAPSTAAPLPAELLRVFRDYGPRFRLDGTETVDGRPAYLLSLEGEGAVADLVPGLAVGGSAAERRGARARYWLDTATLAPLRVELTMGGSGRGTPLKVVFTFSDYRETAGLLLPYRVTLAPDGGPESGAMSVAIREVKVNTPPPAGAPAAR